jgi:hypothetical protein
LFTCVLMRLLRKRAARSAGLASRQAERRAAHDALAGTSGSSWKKSI